MGWDYGLVAGTLCPGVRHCDGHAMHTSRKGDAQEPSADSPYDAAKPLSYAGHEARGHGAIALEAEETN